MYILAIETTGAFASVALLQAGTDGGRILEVIHGNDRFSHLQNLTPQIQQILRNRELSIDDIAAIAVSHGPGSFTGIRIGVSTARALAQVLKIPCIAVSSLEALALRGVGAVEGALLCPVLDARRKQVYGAAYELVDGQLVCRVEPASYLMTEFLEQLDGYLAADKAGSEEAASPRPAQILFLGDGIDTCGGIIREWEQKRNADPEVCFAPEEIRYQDAGTVARRGLQMYLAGGSCEYMDLQPEYLRMAEAEKKLRDRQAAAAASEQEKSKTIQAASAQEKKQ